MNCTRALAIAFAGLLLLQAPDVHAFSRKKPEVTPSELEKKHEQLKTTGLEKLRDGKLMEKAYQSLSSLWGKLVEQINEASISVSIHQGLDLFKGGAVSIGYKEHFEPSYIGGFTKRQDTYKTSLSVNPIQWVIEENTPAVFNITPEIVVDFWQVSQTPWFPQLFSFATDTQPKGYWLNHFPINADRALEKLRPGDTAHLRVHLLNFNVGAQKEWNRRALSQLSLKTNVMWNLSGLFDVFVFRGDDDIIRMRMIASRGDSISAGAQFGVSRGIQIFGFKVLDNRIVRILKADEILSERLGNSNQWIFLADYTIHLGTAQAKTAYNQLFDDVIRFDLKESPLFQPSNPFATEEEIESRLENSLSGLNQLYESERTLPLERRRVERNFLGSTRYSHDKGLMPDIVEGKEGVPIIYRHHGAIGHHRSRMAVQKFTPEGERKTNYYLSPTWSRVNESTALHSLAGEGESKTLNALYESDSGYHLQKLKTIGLYYDRFDKHYKPKDHEDLLQTFREMLPGPLYTKLAGFLDMNNILSLSDTHLGVRVASRFFVKSEGLRLIRDLTAGMTHENIQDLVRSKIVEHLNDLGYSADKFAKDIDPVTHLFAQAIEQDYPQEIVRALVNEGFFRRFGAAFTFKLIPESYMEDGVFFEMAFYLPKQVEPIRFPPEPQPFPDRTLLESIGDVQGIMGNMVPDMRIDGTRDTLTTRAVVSTSEHLLTNAPPPVQPAEQEPATVGPTP